MNPAFDAPSELHTVVARPRTLDSLWAASLQAELDCDYDEALRQVTIYLVSGGATSSWAASTPPGFTR